MSSARSIAVLLLLSLVVTSAAAGAQTDLEDAEAAYNEANQQRSAAQQGVADAEFTRDRFGSELAATLDSYQRTNAEIVLLAQSVAGLRYELGLQEARVRELRGRTEERAVDAYMRNVSGVAAPILLAESFAEVGLVNEVAASQVEVDAALAADIEVARAELEALRAEYDAQRRQLNDLRSNLDRQRDDLELVFESADERVLQAYLTLDEADAAYELALERLEEERRKRRWTGSVEQWRPLVELYFPPERVDEAMSVMWCESRGNPDAKNPASTATGLFQFLSGTWAWSSVQAGWTGHSRLDPEANIAVAAWLVEYSIRTNHPNGAWGHWECQP